MLLGLGLIMFLGWLSGSFIQRIGIPRLVAYLLIGIVLGPSMLDILDENLLKIAGEVRQIALMIILIKAGLTLDYRDLLKVGKPAVLMCFIPALLEILGIGIVGHYILGITYAESLLLGSVLAAVSPAVLVPRMVGLIDREKGTEKGIPQMILAGGTADDILIFVLFAAFMQVNQEGTFSASLLLSVPITIVFGMLIGGVTGGILSWISRRYKLSNEMLLILSIAMSLVMMGLEKPINNWIPYSGVLAVLTCHLFLREKCPDSATQLANVFNRIWSYAEIFLFACLGVTVNPFYILKAGWRVLMVIGLGLIFRMLGVFLSIFRAGFNRHEIIFIMGSYIPKATVQASLGGIPLMVGFASGELILVAATLAILITAPLGALFIDLYADQLLE
ncbi:cation:proton antiporter [Facklamia sp. DSM 111018]|uniref:Cation:proton antiporter n=1 Tax=Facklamia lactis TaxID=2749967 RepID=A0ABS0LUX5_9LACT|nr:cation:proton antiporter [Facklamia lactis]MBG9981358.1 cation:proton antiporter [Facklamia lactis]MBG9987166.1 cation:proton antiporter [Facklamia lactis]